jgi:hypothetical protein
MSFRNIIPMGKMSSCFAPMIEQQFDLESILQQIRLSRLKLGSVLERLENFEPGAEAMNQLQDHADGVAIEIQLFIETLRQLMKD